MAAEGVALLTNMLTAEHRGFDGIVLFGDEAEGGRDVAAAVNAVEWLRDHRVVAAELRDRVLQWHGSDADHYRAHELSQKTREELRALGYVD